MEQIPGKRRLFVGLFTTFLLVGVAFIVFVNYRMRDQALEEAREKAHMVLNHKMAIHGYFTNQLKPELFHTFSRKGIDPRFNPVWMSSSHAVRKIQNRSIERGGHPYYYRECTVNSRSPQNEAKEYEKPYYRQFENNPDMEQHTSIITLEGRPHFVLFQRGETMKESCIRCHSTPARAPEGLVEIYGPERGFGKEVGRMASLASVRIPLEAAFSKANEYSAELSVYLVMLLGLLILVLVFVNKRFVIDPLNNMNRQLIRSRQESEENEKRLRRVIENSPVGIYSYKHEGGELVLSEVNPAADEIMQMDHQERVGMNIKEAFPNLSETGIPDAFRQVLQTGTPWNSEDVTYSDQHITGAFQVHAFRVSADRLAVMFFDVTKRKQAEKTLKDREEFIREALNALPSNIAVIDRKGVIVTTNRAWDNFAEENSGFDTEKIGIGSNYFEVCRRADGKDSEEAPDCFEGLRNVISGKLNVFTLEYPCHSPSQQRWFSMWAAPFQNREMMVISHINITDRKQAEIELENHRKKLTELVDEKTRELKETNALLKQNEERLQSMLQLSLMTDRTEKEIADFALEEAVRLTDSQIGYLHFVREDQKTIEFFTWSQKALKDCTLKVESTGSLDQTGVWADCIRKKRPVIHNDYPAVENRKGLPEGHSTLLRHMSVPVFDDGMIVAVTGVGNKEKPYLKTDADQLIIFMSTMWSIVRRRRMETDLLAAKNEAEAADRAKSEFLASMSHEIRTPLHSIRGAVQTVQRLEERNKLTNQKLERNLKNVLLSSHHLTDIIEDILDLSKIEAGHMVIDFEPVNLKQIIDTLKSSLENQAERKGLRFETSIPEEFPLIRAERKRLTQIIYNLVGNAVKFTESGFVRVEADFLPENDTSVRISISDSGPGIPGQDLSRIFKRFERLETSGQKQGTGLGLAITKHLVEMMGGEISVDSEVGRGSVFYFILEKYDQKTGALL